MMSSSIVAVVTPSGGSGGISGITFGLNVTVPSFGTVAVSGTRSQCAVTPELFLMSKV